MRAAFGILALSAVASATVVNNERDAALSPPMSLVPRGLWDKYIVATETDQSNVKNLECENNYKECNGACIKNDATCCGVMEGKVYSCKAGYECDGLTLNTQMCKSSAGRVTASAAILTVAIGSVLWLF